MCYLVLVILTLGLKSNALRPEDEDDSLQDQALCDGKCRWFEEKSGKKMLVPVETQPKAGSYCLPPSKRLLGQGGFGEVYTAQRKGNYWGCDDIAAKICHVSKRQPADEVMQEYQIQKRLKHPSILQVYALTRRNNDVIIFMEMATGGDLFDKVAKLTEKKESMYFKEVSEGLDYMHQQKIAHLDLKPENILLTGSHAKISFFGLVHDYGTGGPINSPRGSLMYMAPEVARAKSRFNDWYDGYKADVWSLGVTIFAVRFGLFPFLDEPSAWKQVKQAQRTGKSTIAALRSFHQIQRDCSPQLTDLLDGMLRIDPDDRMSITDVLQSQWITRAPALLEIGEAASPEIYELPDGAPKVYRQNAVARNTVAL